MLKGAAPLVAAALYLGTLGSATSQTTLSAASQTTAPERVSGPSTGLPMPRFVSIKGGEARARRGPGWDHRVDWVYQRRGLPLIVVGEFENWRRVQDSEGEGGWMHFSLLSGVRTVLITENMTALRSRPRADSLEIALLEQGVVARILECEPLWCRLSVDDTRGWAERSALWGLYPDEMLE